MLEVKFENVGRNSANWTARCKGDNLEYTWLYKQVKKNSALGSKTIDFSDPDESGRGAIYVGGLRQVGTFTATRLSDPAQPAKSAQK